MPASFYVEISKAQPLRFTEYPTTLPDGYTPLPFDKGLDFQRLRPEQDQVIYHQPWEFRDRIVAEISVAVPSFPATVQGITARLVDSTGDYLKNSNGDDVLIFGQNFAALSGNLSPEGEQMQTFTVSFKPSSIPTLTEGYYRLVPHILFNTDGDPDTEVTRLFVSNSLDIRESHLGTLYQRYSSDTNDNDYDMVFIGASQLWLYHRFQGKIPDEAVEFSTVAEGYDDQRYDRTTLSANTHRVFKLVVGDEGGGIDPATLEKINLSFDFDHNYLQGVEYARQEGAQSETDVIEGFPLVGTTLQIREADTSQSNQFPYRRPVYILSGIEADDLPVLAASISLMQGSSGINFVQPWELRTNDDFIALAEALNNANSDLDGYFEFVDGEGLLYYNAPYENYLQSDLTTSLLTGRMGIAFNGNTASLVQRTLNLRLSITAPGNFIYVGWGDGSDISTITNTAPDFTPHVYETQGSYAAYIYFAPGRWEYYEVASTRITGYSGVTDSSLTDFISKNGMLTEFNGALLFDEYNSNLTLDRIDLSGNDLTSITLTNGNVSSYPLLKTIRLEGNNLSSSEVSDVVVDVYNTLDPLTNGIFTVNNQTPPAPTDTAATAALDDLTNNYGWTTAHD